MIYFIQAGNSGPIKIGYTDNNIKTRLASLQTASPVRLIVLGTIDGTRAVEKKIHNKFKMLRMYGEWFRNDQVLVDYIRTVCNDSTIGMLDDLLVFKTKSLDDILEQIESNYIKLALNRSNGKKQEAAELLGISFRTFRYRCKKYDI